MDATIEHFFPYATITRAIFEALCANPHGLSRHELMWEVYRGRNEPDYQNVISIYICKFNRVAKKRGLGLRIHGVNESGWRYRVFVVRSDAA